MPDSTNETNQQLLIISMKDQVFNSLLSTVKKLLNTLKKKLKKKILTRDKEEKIQSFC